MLDRLRFLIGSVVVLLAVLCAAVLGAVMFAALTIAGAVAAVAFRRNAALSRGADAGGMIIEGSYHEVFPRAARR
jgi:hypothetical protein